jgi:nicotinate-nucleotide adenylyltransferase
MAKIERQILQGDAHLQATIEFNLPRPSFTIDTLTYLKEKYPQHEFSIVMGSDSFTNIKKWKNYELILKNYQIYIYERTGYPMKNNNNASINKLDAPLIEISSSTIRNIIESGKSIRYLVPDVVNQQIKENKYYKKRL